MSPPPQPSGGARTVTGGIKGGSRDIPYLAGVAKFQARGPLFMPYSPVPGRPRGPEANGTAPSRSGSAVLAARGPRVGPKEGPFAHIPDPEPVRLGNIIRGERRNPGKWGRIWPLARAARLQARAEEHHVQRARGQQHEHQRDLQPVAGEFENRPHDLRMMERVRARVSNHIFDLGGRGFRTRLRVDSREPDREKAPEGAAHDPPTCGRFGAKIMRLQIV